MSKFVVYDLPTRIFHWAFSVLFIAAFYIAKTIDDETVLFSYHMLAGLMLAGLVCLRILWGFIGTKYARFSSFYLNPKDLMIYIKGIFTGNKTKWIGHNPASSWSTIIMLTSAAALAITGILMTSGEKETYEDIHELLANIFLITMIVHIAGIIFHTIRHRDGIALAMVWGKKSHEEATYTDSITSLKTRTALILVLFLVLFAGYLYKNFNPSTKELNLFYKVLILGDPVDMEESENERKDDSVSIENENGHMEENE